MSGSNRWPALQLRDMTMADCIAAANLQADTMPNPWSEAQFRDSIRCGHLCRVLTAGRELAAVAVMSVVLDEAELLTIAVARPWQRQGIARNVLQALLSSPELVACHRCTLEVMRGNEPAIALYTGLGFVQIGLRKAYYRIEGEARDALVMQKILARGAA